MEVLHHGEHRLHLMRELHHKENGGKAGVVRNRRLETIRKEEQAWRATMSRSRKELRNPSIVWSRSKCIVRHPRLERQETAVDGIGVRVRID
jgi:hypothetical protein